MLGLVMLIELRLVVFHLSLILKFVREGKDTDKRARNKKLASLFFTASAKYFRDLSQR
jgi:hypothetical protein